MSKVKKDAGCFIFSAAETIGYVLIVLLALPAAFLAFVIYLVWSVSDHIDSCREKFIGEGE